MTKVKGFGYHNNHVMDVADYVSPQQVREPDLQDKYLKHTKQDSASVFKPALELDKVKSVVISSFSDSVQQQLVSDLSLM